MVCLLSAHTVFAGNREEKGVKQFGEQCPSRLKWVHWQQYVFFFTCCVLSGNSTAHYLIMSEVNNAKRDFSWVSMRLWLSWHRFQAEWFVTAEGSYNAESLTVISSHVRRFAKHCSKPPGLSNIDRWQGAVPEKNGRVRVEVFGGWWKLAQFTRHSSPNMIQH